MKTLKLTRRRDAHRCPAVSAKSPPSLMPLLRRMRTGTVGPCP
ncbi:hypothetical protein [Corallococcus sp. BB11-1]|nr:hypothetical protein [Corallococcus sp. BB11-1]